MGGQIVDATVVAAPKQRNSDAEKADIKAGKVPEAWKNKPAKLRQKDRDARWTVKFSKAKTAEEGKTKPRRLQSATISSIVASGLPNAMFSAIVIEKRKWSCGT